MRQLPAPVRLAAAVLAVAASAGCMSVGDDQGKPLPVRPAAQQEQAGPDGGAAVDGEGQGRRDGGPVPRGEGGEDGKGADPEGGAAPNPSASPGPEATLPRAGGASPGATPSPGAGDGRATPPPGKAKPTPSRPTEEPPQPTPTGPPEPTPTPSEPEPQPTPPSETPAAQNRAVDSPAPVKFRQVRSGPVVKPQVAAV